MAGEIGFNPNIAQQYNLGVQSDDAIANWHFNAIQKSGQVPGISEIAGAPAFSGQPETDVFERSSGIGLMGTAATAAAGGLGAGASGYYFLANPVKDLEKQLLNPEFYKTLDKADLAEAIKSKQDALKQTKGYNLAQLAKAESFDALPDEIKTYLQANKLDKYTPEQAKQILENAGKKVEDFDLAKVAQKTTENFKGMQYHANIAGTTGLLGDINNAKNADELKAIITKNKEYFGITGATEAEIAQKVEQLAAKGNANLMAEAIRIQDVSIDYIQRQRDRIFQHIDTKTGKLLDTADDGIKQLFKDFKWSQAKKYGKWGAIAAGAGALLYGLFGGSKKQV